MVLTTLRRQNNIRKEVRIMPKQGKNIYLRKDGRWEGRYPKGHKDGKIQYGYVFGKSYEETVRKLEEALQKINDDKPCVSESFESLSKEWLQVQSPELKPSSIAKYSNTMHSYLAPKFGAQDICDISRNDVILFSKYLLASGGIKGNGLAPKTVNSTLSVLKNIFEYVRREKNFMVAEISDISVKQPQKPMRILSRNEQQRLSQFLLSNLSPCHLGILLCLYTGLRIGEICALKWDDICISEKFLHVNKTMQRIQIPGLSEKKTKVIIQAPKSDCSIRTIPIPGEMLNILLSYQKSADAFLLTGLVHSYIEPRSMENHFKAVTKKCDISNVNFHALRHTFATRCVELGFDIKSLSEILGHASVNITLNRYVHPSMELKQKNMDMLSNLLTTK